MFRGITVVNVDSKGRMAIPVSYREDLADLANGRCVVTIDTEDPCLLLYPLAEWEAIETKLQKLPSFDRKARRIQRLLIGHATDIDMDGQGRILLPRLLREYAGIDKRVMLVGQGKKFELWDENRWEAGRDQWLQPGDDSETGEGGWPDEIKTLSL